MKNRYVPLLLVIVTVVLLFSASAWAASESGAWTGYIRPGVMAGDGNNETNFAVDMLFPVWGTQKSLIYFNPNLRMDDNDSNEQNLGLGYRHLLFDDSLIFGVNAFYDTMRSRTNFRYDQLGFGIEALSKWIDFRGNYYHTIGTSRHNLGSSGTGSGYFFSGNSILVNNSLLIEEAMRGYDAEIGVMLPYISDLFETRAYAGYYWYNSKIADDIKGWKGRMEIWPSKLISLNAEVRHDDFRGTDAFAGGYLNIPFSMDELFKGGNPFKGLKQAAAFGTGARKMQERMTEKVARDRHIVAVERESGGGGSQAVINDRIIFVNQDNENTGSGTYEDPYNDIASAESDDHFTSGGWIYVFSSDTNPDTYNNVGLSLLPSMVLWGQGYRHPVYNLGGEAGNPILDGNGNNVITLADNNEIMGLTVQGGNHGIYGSNVKGTYIHDNTIRWNGAINSGIHIQNNFTPADIDGTSLVYRFENNQVLNNTGSGIYLYNRVNGSGKLENVSIDNIFTNNIVQGNSGYGIYSYFSASLNNPNSFINSASFSNTLTGNTVGGSGEGQGNSYDGILAEIDLYTSGATSPISNTSLTSRIVSNTVVNNGWDGISDDYLYVSTSGSDSGLSNVRINRYVTDNEIRGNSYDGYKKYQTALRTQGTNSPITDSFIDSQINRNTISGNGNTAINLSGSDISTNGSGSPISRSTIANVFNQNNLNVATPGEDGIRMYSTYIRTASASSGLTDVSIDSTFNGNNIDGATFADDGIELVDNVYILASNSNSPIANASITNRFENNTVRNFAGNGLYFPGNYIRTGPFSFYAGNSTNSPISGSTINNILTNNTVIDNDGYGVYNWRNEIKTPAGVSTSSTNNTYTGNTVDRNGFTGIYIDEDFGGGTNTSMNYSFTNNFIRNNGSLGGGSYGLYIYSDPSNGDQITKTFFMQGNTVTQNAGTNLWFYFNALDASKLSGDFGGGTLGSTGGNDFSGSGAGAWDIYVSGGPAASVISATGNAWSNNGDPEAKIRDHNDNAGLPDIAP